MGSNRIGRGRLAQELLTVADRRGAELNLHWGEAIEALGIAAKSLVGVYSPMKSRDNAGGLSASLHCFIAKGAPAGAPFFVYPLKYCPPHVALHHSMLP